MKTLTRNSLLLAITLTVTPLSQAGVLSPDNHQEVAKDGVGVINTGDGNVTIGFTQKEYEAGLKQRVAEVTARLEELHVLKQELLKSKLMNKTEAIIALEKLHASEQKLLEEQLQTIQQRLLNSKQSYEKYIKSLEKRIAQLETIRGLIPDELLDMASQWGE